MENENKNEYINENNCLAPICQKAEYETRGCNNCFQNKILNGNVLQDILFICNPKLNLCNNHYVCGRGLAIFTNLAQIENYLTCLPVKLSKLPPKPRVSD